MSFKYYIFFLFILFAHIVSAQKASQVEIVTIVSNFLSNSSQTELINETPQIESVYSETTNDVLFYIFNYKKAFIIISANKSHIPIKAFSFENNFNTKKITSEIGMLDILISDYERFNIFLSENSDVTLVNQKKWQEKIKNKTVKNINDAVFGPYLSSIYGQTWYYENGDPIYTTNYFTPNHNPVGCVALTFTEIMQYYNWPRKGVGSHSYSDNYGSTTGTFQANFDENYYNWDLVLDEYKGVSTTDAQRSQLGKIAYHAAVSVDMEFESNGSTSNINRIPNAANRHFRYNADYKAKSASDFWQVLDTNLHHGIPAQFAIYTSSGAGHAVVGDGIKYVGDDKYYHLNMGWWGTTNGWYQIHQSFNAGGYTNVTAAVLNMIPVPELNDKPKFDFDGETVELTWYYTLKIIPENYEMQIKRGVADWETYTDTITQTSFIFNADAEKDYSVRIRAKVNNTWTENSWSNIVSFGPDDYIIEGDEDLTLYPTIADKEIKISYEKLSGSVIKVFNLQGVLKYETNEEILLNEYVINVSSFETGFYIIQIINETERETIKFIKL